MATWSHSPRGLGTRLTLTCYGMVHCTSNCERQREMATSSSTSLSATDKTLDTSETANSTSDQHSSDSSASDSDIGSETTQSTEYSGSGCSDTSSDSWTSDSSDEDEDNHKVGDQSNYLMSPLYDGASIRVVDSYLLSLVCVTV